jgi:hypothetical protein
MLGMTKRAIAENKILMCSFLKYDLSKAKLGEKLHNVEVAGLAT